ncbi:MAG: hypothetical protein AAF513_03755 [Pseudomonadota bacterium]
MRKFGNQITQYVVDPRTLALPASGSTAIDAQIEPVVAPQVNQLQAYVHTEKAEDAISHASCDAARALVRAHTDAQ